MQYLGYAVTVHRAQGATVDTAHAIVHSAEVTREALYVAMTRGRTTNRVYVATDQALVEEHQQRPPEEVTARTVLEAVIRHTGAEPSAHDAIVAEQEVWSGIGQLAAEYDTIAKAGQQERWIRLLEHSGLTPGQVEQVCDAESFGSLAMLLRRLDANRVEPELLLPRLLAQNPIAENDEVDVVATLRKQLQHESVPLTGSTQRLPPSLIAGLIPRAEGLTDSDLRRGLEEREHLIVQRAQHLAQTALDSGEAWTASFGTQPVGRTKELWIRQVETVAAYRDRYRIDGSLPLGPEPTNTPQRIDAARAKAALERARTLADRRRGRPSTRATVEPVRTRIL